MKTEKYKLKNKIRRLSKKEISQISTENIKSLFSFFDGKCAYCETNKAVCLDHVQPLKYVTNNNCNNLLPVCNSCNSSKGGKDFLQVIYWYHNRFNKTMSDKIKAILFHIKSWDELLHLPYSLEDNESFFNMLEEFKRV